MEEEKEISTVEDLEITASMKGPNLVVAILKEGGRKRRWAEREREFAYSWCEIQRERESNTV